MGTYERPDQTVGINNAAMNKAARQISADVEKLFKSLNDENTENQVKNQKLQKQADIDNSKDIVNGKEL
jgi:hypothetical protein